MCRSLARHAAGLFALGGSTALADVVVLSPVADNTMYEYVAADGDLSNGGGQYLFAGRNGGALDRRALLRFDPSAVIPAGSTITSATLTLNVSRTQTALTNVHCFAALQSWGEGSSIAAGGEGVGAPPTPGEATWRHRFYPDTLWTFPGGFINSAPSATAAVVGLGTAVWTGPDLTADVQGWILQPASNSGWVLASISPEPATAVRFDSRENADVSKRPVLVIEFIRPNLCDPDVNQDGNADQSDVAYLVTVVSGGPNPTGINPDFNIDGNVDQADVDALLNVVAGGDCP